MIALSKPKLGKNALKYVTQAIKANQVSQGDFVPRLERNFAKFTGFKHASACSSGTMALFLALRAVGVEDGEVIMPSLTFAATADAVLMAGAKPVFCDLGPGTQMSESSVKRLITPKTRAIISVDIYGIPSSHDHLKIFKLPIIEDACQALGAKLHAGADITCFSFFGNKVMTTGEGGMCVTNDPKLKEKLDRLRNHGRMSGFWHEERGTNGRMSNIHAAIGLSQLEDLPKNLKKRRQILKWYGASTKTAPWLHCINTPDKEEKVKELQSKGVDARVGFYGLHEMPAYKQDGVFPVTELWSRYAVLLPLHPDMTKKDVARILTLI